MFSKNIATVAVVGDTCTQFFWYWTLHLLLQIKCTTINHLADNTAVANDTGYVVDSLPLYRRFMVQFLGRSNWKKHIANKLSLMLFLSWKAIRCNDNEWDQQACWVQVHDGSASLICKPVGSTCMTDLQACRVHVHDRSAKMKRFCSCYSVGNPMSFNFFNGILLFSMQNSFIFLRKIATKYFFSVFLQHT